MLGWVWGLVCGEWDRLGEVVGSTRLRLEHVLPEGSTDEWRQIGVSTTTIRFSHRLSDILLSGCYLH